MAKQVYECNWVPSRITETQLNNLVLTGALSSKNAIHWRVPGNECPPTPQEGEVVVFADHLARRFRCTGLQAHDGPECISGSPKEEIPISIARSPRCQKSLQHPGGKPCGSDSWRPGSAPHNKPASSQHWYTTGRANTIGPLFQPDG